MNPGRISRRMLLTGTAMAACGRKLAARYAGFLYVARAQEKSIALIDLSNFQWAGKIDLPTPPSQIARAGDRLFAVCPESLSVYPLDLENAKHFGGIRFPSRPDQLFIRSDGETGIAISYDAARCYNFDLRTGKLASHLQLPAPPGGMDDSSTALAVTIPSRRSVLIYDSKSTKPTFSVDVGSQVKTIRFRGDGQTLLLGALQDRQILTVDVRAGRLLTRLPIPIMPERFCFNSNGGQMFVSGSGGDAIVIVNPYQNEVDQTILAGRTPGAMTTTNVTPGAPELLLVANPDLGDLTIIDIDTRHVSASVHVGQRPGSILVTPNNEFVLALNRLSGDVAVLRLKTVLDHKNRTKPLFTVVPVGAEPVSAVIMPALA